MKYEIINPSDKVFLTADNLVDAALICSTLSNWYGLEDDKGEQVFPILANNKWFADMGVADIQEYIKTNYQRIADVANSCEYAHKRSSINNIGANCKLIAKHLIKKYSPKN